LSDRISNAPGLFHRPDADLMIKGGDSWAVVRGRFPEGWEPDPCNMKAK
jgi:hypothetical protein